MKKIKVIELGGTMSAAGEDRLDFKDYTSGIYTGETYLKDIPELSSIANVSFESFLRVSSTAIQTEHWIQLRNKIQRDIQLYDGVVLTHGTNTIEETAYFLHLTVNTDKPIIIVGSQRPYSAISSDAHANLLQAIRVAASDEAKGYGVLVVLNDEINCAREVTKTNTYRLETFQSGQLGYLGFIDPDKKVHMYRKPVKKHTYESEFSKIEFDTLKNVEIIYSYAGASGHLIDYIIASKYFSGIVTAGTGAGLVAPDELDSLRNAVEEGLFIVRSSRVGNGRVMDVAPYRDDAFIHADNLLPQKARILLMLALTTYTTVHEIQQVFDQY